MSSVKIIPEIPSGALVPTVASSSKYIISKSLREFQPQTKTTFSKATTDRIIFDISSPTSFVDWANSYLKFNLTCSLHNNGANDPAKYLAEGGGHSLFQNIIIETQSGTLIQRINHVNKLYAIMNNLTIRREDVDSSLLKAADSADYSPYEQSYQVDDTPVPFRADEAKVENLSSGQIDLYLWISTAPTDPIGLEVGDLVTIITKTTISSGGTSVTVRVVSKLSGAAQYRVNGTNTSIAAGDISAISVQRGSVLISPTRQLAANTTKYQVCMRPFMPLLEMESWFPLFLVRGGLRITLELELPQFVMASYAGVVGTGFDKASCDYTIDNPVYMCSLIQPDPTLSQQYLDAYKSSGIVYQSFDYSFSQFSDQGAASPFSMQLQPSFRSGRTFIMQIQDLRATTDTSGTANTGKSVYTCDSIAQGLKAGMSDFIIQSGSTRLPYNKPLDTTSPSNAELLTMAESALERLKRPHGMRMEMFQWQTRQVALDTADQGSSSGRNDSRRLYYVVDLARNDSHFSGLDLSLNNLQVDMTFNSAYELVNYDGSSPIPASRYFNCWVCGDSAILISESAGLVVYK